MIRQGLVAVLCLLTVASAAQFVLPGLGMDNHVSAGEPQAWPNLLGKEREYAKSIIMQEAPNLSVYMVPVGNLVTMDFRFDRVRIFYDPATNTVAEVPRVG